MRTAIVAFTILGSALVAHADPARATIVAPFQPPILPLETRLAEIAPTTPAPSSYRWQIAIADVAALGASLVATQPGMDHRDGFRAVGFGTYALGAPIIHTANGRPLRGVASLGLRAGLPLIGGLLGRALTSGSDCAPTSGLCGDARPQGGIVIGVGPRRADRDRRRHRVAREAQGPAALRLFVPARL